MQAATRIRSHPARRFPRAAALAAALVTLAAAGCGPAPGAGSPGAGGDREVALAGWNQRAPELMLPVPEGFELKSKQGDDFDVHYIARPGRRAADAHGTVYIGRGPNLFHKQRADEVSDVTSATEALGGRQTTIYAFTTPGKGTFHKEAILEGVFAGATAADDDVRGLLVHIACGGASKERVEDLWQHLARVRVR